MRAAKSSGDGGSHAARRGARGRRLSFILRTLGPGLITGAADDDPSGIATYSQGGAQFGFGALWTLMGRFVVTARLKWLGWGATSIMASAVVMLGWSLARG